MFDVGCLTWQTLSNVKLFLSNTQLSTPPSLHNLLFKLFVGSDQAVFIWKETFSRLYTLMSSSDLLSVTKCRVEMEFWKNWCNFSFISSLMKCKTQIKCAAGGETGGWRRSSPTSHWFCTLKSANIMWTWGVFASNFVRFCNVYTDQTGTECLGLEYVRWKGEVGRDERTKLC